MSSTTRYAPVGQGLHADILIPVPDGWQNESASRREGEPESETLAVTSPATSDEDALLERVAALTVVKLVVAPKGGMGSSRRPHDVVREVRVLRNNHQANIVRLLDYSFDELRLEHVLTLPLLAVTLGDLLLDSISLAHPVELCIHAASGLFAALDHLHNNAVAHRDIKPTNVMFGFDGVPVLIDFGTAWDGEARGDGEGDMSCSVGTGPYRAPELLFSPPTYDAFALDLWSAGVMLAEFFRPRGKRESSLGISDTSDSTGSYGDEDDIRPPDYRNQGQPEHATAPSGTPGDTPAQAAQAAQAPSPGLDRLDASVPAEEPLSAPAPLFSAAFGELGLAASIFRLLGTPTPETWPSFTALPDAGKMPFDAYPARRVREALQLGTSSSAMTVLDVIEGLVVLEPARRRSARDTLSLLGGPEGAELRPLVLRAAERYSITMSRA